MEKALAAVGRRPSAGGRHRAKTRRRKCCWRSIDWALRIGQAPTNWQRSTKHWPGATWRVRDRWRDRSGISTFSAMKVRYSPHAAADLIAIADYLTERNPPAARAVEIAPRRSIDLLGEFPGSGRVLTQWPDVRVMPLTRYPYLIFYMVSADELLILHIRHGARAPIGPEDL